MEKIKPLNREDWVDADPANGVAGAIPPAKAFSQTMEEMVNVIIASGQEPSGEDLHQFEKGIKGLVKKEVDEANLLAVSNTVYQNHVGSFVFTHNKMRGTKATGSLNGCYECNGDEFSEADFEGDVTPYKLLCDNVLPWVSYVNYQQILDRFGNCGFYGLDKESHTFKVPTITNAFLQAGTPGTFKEAGIPNILGKFESGANSGWADSQTGWEGAFKLGKARGGTGSRRGTNQFQGEFDASLANPVYGKSETVQPNAVGCRIMVQLANEIDNATSIEKYLNQLKDAKNEGLNSINAALENLEQNEAEALEALASDKTAALSAVANAQSAAVQALNEAGNKLLTDIDGDRTEFENYIDKVVEPKYTAFDKVVDKSDVNIETLTQQNTKAEENIAALTELNNTAEKTVQTVTEKAAEAAESAQAAEAAKTAAETAVNGFDAHVADKTSEAETAIDTAKTAAVQAVNDAAKEVSKAVSAASTAATQATQTANTAKETANSVVEQLSGFENTVTAAKNGVTALSGTQKDAITTQAGEEKTAIATAAETAKTSAVGAVNTAKNEAVQEVEAAGAAIAGYQPAIVPLPADFTLEVNKVYSGEISAAAMFVLPPPSNTGFFNQIKVMLKVIGTPTINWGTTNFFNKETPEIEAGCYDVYFDYDNNLNAWVCGAMAKGAAE